MFQTVSNATFSVDTFFFIRYKLFILPQISLFLPVHSFIFVAIRTYLYNVECRQILLFTLIAVPSDQLSNYEMETLSKIFAYDDQLINFLLLTSLQRESFFVLPAHYFRKINKFSIGG